jgi:hypothetical protein
MENLSSEQIAEIEEICAELEITVDYYLHEFLL